MSELLETLELSLETKVENVLGITEQLEIQWFDLKESFLEA